MSRTLGIEIEMPVAASGTGRSHKVAPYFQTMAELKRGRGIPASLVRLQGSPVAVHAPACISGLDNAYNNLESALGPFGGPGALQTLHATLETELDDIRRALSLEPGGAFAVNFSEHPCVRITRDYYYDIRPPKPIYDYWVNYRGWGHLAGVDAKSHNGPTTGVAPTEAVLCLNVLLAASPCFIALYANSPFESGRPTGFLENRLTLWPRMFAASRFACDRRLHRMPERPFLGWGDYFQWMFGPGTCMQFVVPPTDTDYKTPSQILQPEGDPPLLEYLHAASWRVRPCSGGQPFSLRPELRHLEFLQFSHFLDARLRFGLQPEASLEEFLARLDTCSRNCPRCSRGDVPAWECGCPSAPESDFCDYFASQLRYVYIEGRAPGANLPDAELACLDNADIPASVAISASAMQLGLFNRLEEARKLLSAHPWSTLRQLREESLRHGLAAESHGLHVSRLCHELLDLAQEGLPPETHWMLAYPRHVLQTGRSGAARALAAFERMSGGREARLLRLVQQRALVRTG